MPKPKPNESRNDYISRCIPIVIDEGTAEDPEQAAAICYSMWRESKKTMTNDQLVKAVQSREKKTEFWHGISTADRYVKTLLETAGLEVCYRYGSKGQTSFNDVLEKASRTLVYSNEDMVVQQKSTDIANFAKLPDGVDLPKNCLMVFKHVLTTPRKDRDGDILRTEGMAVDPKMLLLWQHVHTMPIGKMLVIAEHNDKRLSLYSCIVDMNDLCHDAAVMIDNGMGRFSHGFRALEFDKVKARDGSESGYDIKKGEIMEESLVSVPANVDAETEHILLSLVEGGKLTSPIMKEVGRGLREHQPVSVPVKLDLKVVLNGQEIKNEDERRDRKGEEETEQVTTSEEADADTDEIEIEGTEDEEVKKAKPKVKPTNSEDGEEEDDEKPEETTEEQELVCPKCGSKDIVDGVCQDCGANVKEEEGGEKEEEEKTVAPDNTKAGRVLSKANETKIADARDDVTEAMKMDLPRPCKALLRSAASGLTDVLDSLGTSVEGEKETGVDEAMAIVLANATKSQRSRMVELLQLLDVVDSRSNRVKQYLALVGKE